MRYALPAAIVALILALPAASAAAGLALSSRDLTPGAPMAAKHIYRRCGGQNVSPALSWSGAPPGTKSLVLTMIDMDVKPALWSHWIVVDLAPTARGLAQGVKALPAPAHGVISNFGDASYDGPCPPAGSGVHHYQFTIWAMRNAKTELPGDAKAPDVIATLTTGSLAHADLVSTVAAKP